MSSIMWHKWRNPLRVPHPENELTPAEIETRDSFRESDESRPAFIGNFIGALSVGNLGVVPVWSGTQCDDLFNFWEGHTAFAIRPLDKMAIEGVNGVEEFTLLTPYRFRIAIAKHPSFKPVEVKKKIEGLFNGYC